MAFGEARLTTIAYSRGVLAADSASTSNGILCGVVTKLARSPDGHIAAVAGSTLDCAAIRRWVAGGLIGETGVSGNDSSGLLIKPDGSVHLLGSDGALAPIEAEYHATGSGWQIALGAMAAGASAEEAVRIACRLDGGSCEPIHVMRLGE